MQIRRRVALTRNREKVQRKSRSSGSYVHSREKCLGLEKKKHDDETFSLSSVLYMILFVILYIEVLKTQFSLIRAHGPFNTLTIRKKMRPVYTCDIWKYDHVSAV
jgi:hypothetical protein